jgi:hypothetical protein
MKRTTLLVAFLVAVALACAVAIRLLPSETTLPNGFVLQGRSVVLSPNGRSVLASDVEFVCFDDRFLWVITDRKGQGGLFDARSRSRVDERDHTEIFEPGGLRYGREACNGYYTSMISPGLLHGGTAWPFMPSCDSVNRENPALQDKVWLSRPCATH